MSLYNFYVDKLQVYTECFIPFPGTNRIYISLYVFLLYILLGQLLPGNLLNIFNTMSATEELIRCRLTYTMRNIDWCTLIPENKSSCAVKTLT